MASSGWNRLRPRSAYIDGKYIHLPERPGSRNLVPYLIEEIGGPEMARALVEDFALDTRDLPEARRRLRDDDRQERKREQQGGGVQVNIRFRFKELAEAFAN